MVKELWSHGLIEARDWVKGLGQGFGLTADGERALREPAFLAKLLAGKTVETEVKPRPVLTTWDRGERARQSFFDPKPAIVTQSLVMLNMAVFVIGLSIAWRSGGGRVAYLNGTDLGTLLKLGAVSGDSLARGEWWRLFAANFVHIGAAHLLLNVYCLGMLGGLAENLWGRKRFIALYLASGLSGTCLAMMLKPGSAVAGASGATWGVMTSLGVWIFLYRQHFDAGIIADFARRTMVAVLLNGIVSFWPRVSWEGHMGGAIGGVVMAFALDLIRPGYRRRTIAGFVGAIGFPIATVAALVLVALRSDAWRPVMFRESIQQQVSYLKALQPGLEEISPLQVANLMASFHRTKNVVVYFAKVEQSARELQAKAEQLRGQVPAAPFLVAECPDKVRAYCDSVIAFTQQMIEYLRGDRADLDSSGELRKSIDEHWMRLHQNAGAGRDAAVELTSRETGSSSAGRWAGRRRGTRRPRLCRPARRGR